MLKREGGREGEPRARSEAMLSKIARGHRPAFPVERRGRQRRQKGQKKIHYSLEPATEVEIEVVSGRHMTTQNVAAASALKQHL